MLRILLLEDSLLDTELIQTYLIDGGINCELVRVEGCTDFQNALATQSFDLILSDYSLPAFDGITALAMAQATCPDLPFIFVSATLGEELAIETLKNGATDYVLKQRLERLVPSVKRALREMEERFERKRAEAALRQLAVKSAFLAEASRILASCLDYETTLASVAKLAVPFLADWCTVDILEDNQSIRRVAIAHCEPVKEELAWELNRRYPDQIHAVAGLLPHVLRTGQSELVSEMQNSHLVSVARDAEHLQILNELGLKSVIVVPLIARGRTLGAIVLLTSESGRHYTSDELTLAEDLAQRAAMAVDNARLYREMQEARETAEAANRMKDEFLATLSHELRTPLNAMLGWTQLLRTRALDQIKMDRALETIERNTKSLAALIEDILDVSRIITGKLKLSAAPCDLVSVIEAAIETIRPTTKAKYIQLECFLDPGVGLVWGDANRLQQVVWNLLSNAIKFTGKGGRVEVRLEQVDILTNINKCDMECDNPKSMTPAARSQSDSFGASAIQNLKSKYAQIQVTDTGKGIFPDFLPYVFERFRQENSGSTRSYGGLGLGLAIVRYLVEQHGGIVQAFSQGEGMGATFTVQLPQWTVHRESTPKSTVQPAIELVANPDGLLTPTPPPEQFLPNTANGRVVPPALSPILYGLRVLIVDDEADARDLLLTILQQSGAQVIAAKSASEVLYLLPQSNADVLVSDIGMPKIDGYTLMRQIRKLDAEHGGDIPAVALTAYARESERKAALDAGFQVHLSKPFDPDQLVEMVATLARGKPSKSAI